MRNEDAVFAVFYHCGIAAVTCGNDRQGKTHGFGNGKRGGFRADRAIDIHIGGIEIGGNIVDKAAKIDPLIKIKFAGKGLQGFFFTAFADNEDFDGLFFPCKKGGGFDQNPNAFVRLNSAANHGKGFVW